MRKNLYGCTRDEISSELAVLKLPAYRAQQVFQWVHRKNVLSWDEMSSVPKETRTLFSERFSLSLPETAARLTSKDGTVKLLLRMPDGHCIETVVIPSGTKKTVCVSTQVGCRFNCLFCASGAHGFVRDLTAAEIVGQVVLAGAGVSNLVFMGMGEPMDNLDEVMRAIEILNDPLGRNIGARHITVSTSGIVPGIERLASFRKQVRLSVSLHATNDSLRSRLMPVNKMYPLRALEEACRRYALRTGRRITLEYALIGGVNDGPKDAQGLARIARGLGAYVNLIPLSPVRGVPFSAPGRQQVVRFTRMLRDANVNVAVRRSRGSDISAACGQLAGAGNEVSRGRVRH